MKRWEYRSLVMEIPIAYEEAPTLADKLNELGGEGWEAWHMFFAASNVCVWLKREIISDAARISDMQRSDDYLRRFGN